MPHTSLTSPEGMAATGLAVAASRLQESRRPDRLFEDPLAETFLEAIPGDVPSADDEAPFARGYFALRTRWFDETVQDAVQAGRKQVVILACGYDTRAYRLNLASDVTVFEIDLPATMDFKNKVLNSQDSAPTAKRIGIGSDLRQSWRTALHEAGFNPQATTHWVLEGILPYLTTADAAGVLSGISAVSAAGSSLALEYINQATLDLPPLKAMLEQLADDGAAWRSAVDDPVAWLGQWGWAAALTDVAALARTLGRDVPMGMNHEIVGEARCWLANARLLGKATA